MSEAHTPTCPECAGARVYETTYVPAMGHPLHDAGLLPGLGSFGSPADFTIRVCADCGLTRLYAHPEARGNLVSSERWKPLA